MPFGLAVLIRSFSASTWAFVFRPLSRLNRRVFVWRTLQQLPWFLQPVLSFAYCSAYKIDFCYPYWGFSIISPLSHVRVRFAFIARNRVQPKQFFFDLGNHSTFTLLRWSYFLSRLVLFCSIVFTQSSVAVTVWTSSSIPRQIVISRPHRLRVFLFQDWIGKQLFDNRFMVALISTTRDEFLLIGDSRRLYLRLQSRRRSPLSCND